MTDDEIKELMRLESLATKAPWVACDGSVVLAGVNADAANENFHVRVAAILAEEK